ncbi:hypothetical protein BGZ75_005459 [Mortierella antarctica]|nr:hypothetical protein BGZ75_005459 [Mortierella antarctica]
MSWVFQFDNEASCNGQHFDITLGFSMMDVIIEQVESITFDLLTEQGQLLGYSETADAQTIRDWCISRKTGAQSSDVREWRLHQRLVCSNVPKRIMVSMKIESSQSVQSKAGYFEMHHMDTCISSRHIKDALLLQLKPFIWSIDTGELYDTPTSTNRPSICDYEISGDGSTATTLSIIQSQLALDIWDLRSPGQVLGLATGDLGHQSFKSFTPRHCAHVQVQETMRGKVFVSISWDGTQIAVTDTSDMKSSSLDISYRSNAPILYRYDRDDSSAKGSVVSALGSLCLSLDYQKCKGLDSASGYGKFHMQETTNQVPAAADERFIICDGHSVSIYSVFPTWKLRTTIVLDQPQQDRERIIFRNAPQELIRSLCGRYFTWAGHDDDMVSVCDMDTGAVVPCFPKILQETPKRSCRKLSTCFSSNGARLAIARDRTLTLHNSISGDELESFVVPYRDMYIKSIQFLREDKQLLVEITADRRTSTPWEPGFLLNAETLLVLGRAYIPSPYPARVFGEHILYRRRSTLDLIRVENIIVQPHTQPDVPTTTPCNAQCPQQLSTPTECSRKFLTSSGLTFELERSTVAPRQENTAPSLVVYMQKNGEDRRRKLTIAPIHSVFDRRTNYKSAYFLEHPTRLVVESSEMIMIWSVPTNPDEDLVLTLAWGFRDAGTWDAQRRVCSHQQIYFLQQENVIQPETRSCGVMNHAFSKDNAPLFLKGVRYLINVFKNADKICGDAIIRYVGAHMNTLPDPDHIKDSILRPLFSERDDRTYKDYELFVSALLGSPHGRWVPRKGLEPEANPLWIRLTLAKTKPRAIGLAEILIDYCLSRATAEKDSRFLAPILQSLPLLTDRKQQSHSDLAIRTLRRMVYFPVKSRSYIINRHKIAHPIEFPPLWFWWLKNDRRRPLYECEDPVMQLSRHTSGGHDAGNDNFSKELYLASFDMIWQCRRHGTTGSSSNNRAVGSTAWSQIFFKALFQSPTRKVDITVRCHDFTLEALDNPAIAALVEFKWSIFNIVDLAAFGLPLAGSINQLAIVWGPSTVEANPGFLSFSVLFISLQFLFQLRINKSVCHFVTIIIQVISKIRVFFFILAGGILAFTTAILHLLLACPFSTCEEPTTNTFPKQFYKAISTTFYFIGGRYDSIADEFTTDNWAFHTMMMFNFFFTGVLILNVLIALINVAFTKGDETWRLVWLQNRMKFVESAEAISFQIPGFREAHNWFPNEIYYSATPQKARSYKRDTENMIRELSTYPSDMSGPDSRTELNVAEMHTPATSSELERRLEEQRLLLLRQEQQFADQTRTIRELREQLATQKQALEVRDKTMQDQLQHILTMLAPTE